MTDYLVDTPNLAVYWCPGCRPDADPTQEILEIRYCSEHEPQRAGSGDEQVTTQAYLSGSAEAGGLDNKTWCDALHRGIWPSANNTQ